MRRRVTLLCLAMGAGAVAAPAAPPTTTWAEWVGDWQGKLRWTSCTTDGKPSALLPVDASDGAIAIDLGDAEAGLGALSLVEDNGGWIGQRGDVTVHLARPGADALELAVDFDSGCQIRGTLHRATSGLPACDRLAAWARIEAKCTKLARPPLENPARVAHQRESWLKARRDARAGIVAQCDARAVKVEEELVDAGCAPNPDPLLGLRGTECQALLHSTQRLARCASVPADFAAIIAQQAFALVGAAQRANDADLKVLEQQCRRTRERIVQTGHQAGCPI
ncbi:MAG: hypothetical protein ACM31C_34050 [Acidobacteriota bacterium]